MQNTYRPVPAFVMAEEDPTIHHRLVNKTLADLADFSRKLCQLNAGEPPKLARKIDK